MEFSKEDTGDPNLPRIYVRGYSYITSSLPKQEVEAWIVREIKTNQPMIEYKSG